MSTPDDDHPQRRLRSLVIVFRHGARGPTNSGLRKLAGAFTCGRRDAAASPRHAVHEWQPSELEHTTSVGDEQMRLLGKYAAQMTQHALPTMFSAISSGSFTPTWRSSIVPRALRSGREFWAGFASVAPSDASLPTEPIPYASHAVTDAIYRPWESHAPWRAACAALSRSVTFQRAALKVRDRLERIEAAIVGGASHVESSGGDEGAVDGPFADMILDGEDGPKSVVRPSDADAVAGDDADDVHLASLLYHTTYAWESLECERAWPSTALALRNGGAYGVVASPRCALTQRLSSGDAAFLQHAATWTWDQRFFGDAGARSHALAIGGALLRQVVMELADTTQAFTVHSAHDFSILATLAAMRVKKHPPGSLGFGAFLVFECWEEAAPAAPASEADDSGATEARVFDPARASVDVRICTQPFPHVAEGYPLHFVPHMHNVVADVSLAALQHVVAKVPEPAAASAAHHHTASAAASRGAAHAHYGSMPMH